MRDRPVDPSVLVNDDTPDGFDAGKVIERWREIEERGHPLGPNRSADTDIDRSAEGSDE